MEEARKRQKGGRPGRKNMLKTAMIFNDGMVLQRGKPVPVWGSASPGEEVTAVLGQETQKAAAGDDGEWKIVFSPLEAAEGLTLTIRGESEEIIIHDVAVGEVWIAGGQSNMEFYLGYESHYDEIKDSFQNNRIRFFDYPEAAYEEALTDFNYKNEGFWRYAGKEDLAYFSAVGFYFAVNLQEDLGVPVGIVGCNWGGTPACSWMEPERLVGTKGEVWLADQEEAEKEKPMEQRFLEYRNDPLSDHTDIIHDPVNIRVMRDGLTREEQLAEIAKRGPIPAKPFFFERRVGALYNTMLKKVAPYAARGVIWYQGETDGDYHPDAYTEVFTRMIESWRDLWQEELPFLFVQLAPYGAWMEFTGEHYGLVRMSQDEVSRTVPGTWMAVTGDVGMEWDIHPKNKQPVGERLALLARGHVYGEDILCDAPDAEMAGWEGDRLLIRFRNAEGLHIEGESLNALFAVEEDGSRRPVTQAETNGNALILMNAGDAVSVEFAMEPYYEVNLYNGSHIPARPFRLDILKKAGEVIR